MELSPTEKQEEGYYNGVETDSFLQGNEDHASTFHVNNEKEPLLRRKDKHADEAESDEGKPKKLDTVSFFELFRYADKLDVFLIIIAAIASIGNGLSRPVQFIIYGELIGKFVEFGKNSTSINIADEMKTFAIYYIILGAYTMVVSFFQAAFWSISAVRQVHKIRKRFFTSILKQDIGWYDVNESGGLTTRISDDLTKIHTGIGDKFGLLFAAVTTFFGGFGIGFYYSWELTLIAMSLSPALAFSSAIIGKVIAKITSNEQAAYAEAGSIAEEAISSIRTVMAFGGQQDEISRYEKKLKNAEVAGVKKSITMGLTFVFFQLVVLVSYSLTFWYGSKMVADGKITTGTLLLVFFCVLTAAGVVGQISPNFEALTIAKGAAFFVYKVCEMEPVINSLSEEGKHLEYVEGNFLLQDVHFSYPSRPDIKVLDGFSLQIKTGTTVAMVGESGCGKSTIIKLIQRFYDIQEGSIYFDGSNVKELNVKSLRSNIGVVSQEPVLFDFSIAENIKFGAVDEVTQAEIERAAKEANAHDFIIGLPQGYQTKVGEGGVQLSGGQKQRIAIARALIRDPKVLLLDEATSALDTESERIVQAALNKASKGRTTIIIAHRLTTIRNADVIVAVKDGRVAEMGKHKELMAKKGVYHQLVVLQTAVKEGEDVELTETERDEIKMSIIKTNFQTSQDTFSHSLSIQQSMTDEIETAIEEPAPFYRVIKLNSPEWPYLLFGCFFSTFNGIFPVAFAVIFSELLLTLTNQNPDKVKETSQIWSLAFLGLGSILFLGTFLSSFLFGKAGEVLTRRLRKLAFTSIMKQDVEFFDDSEHSTGQLTASLATDASNVKGATSSRLNSLIQVLVTLVTALGIAFYYSWKLTLVILSFAPFVMFTGSAHMAVFKNFAAEEVKKLTDASALANQAIMNIRTVASLGQENYFIENFTKHIQKPYKKSLLKSNVFGITFGLGATFLMLALAGAFAYGGKLVKDGELSLDDMFKVVFACVFGALIAGEVMSFAPDYLAAKVSAARIFKLLDRRPAINSFSTEGEQLSNVEGNINFENVSFRYPTRANVQVLKGLSLTINSGQKVALVGASGCGKSTCVSLLERFYDPISGSIKIDNHDIHGFNVQWLRSQLGLVSQEPVLFARSIRENILYGLNREVDDIEVIKAAKDANIHSFIASLPKGYDTMVGEKGTLISGGQKQRVAIARALIRNPKIILLDEATSALDSESEKIVQQALDTAMEGRTSIIIAHRLSTIQNADLIVVVQGGNIVEAGNHQELMAKQGSYYLLNQAQF